MHCEDDTLEHGDTMTVLPIRPIGDRFVAKVLEGDEERRLEGSEFILPKRANSKPMRVEVVEISDKFLNDGLDMKVGDVVLISKYGSTAVTYGERGERFQLCNRADIIGIL